jgi:hypothetical protein
MATYKKEKDATREVDEAAKKGWMPQGGTATDGHINVGRTVTGTVLTGGLYLLIGGSRSKGMLTITYVRTPDWLEKQKRGDIRDIPEQIKTMTFGEDILYADKPMSNRASLVLTNQKIILYTTNFSKWSGKSKNIETIEEHSWRDFKKVSVNIGKFSSDIKLVMTGKSIIVNDIDKNKAEKISAILSKMKEIALDGSNTKTSTQNPTQKLLYLKEMLDSKLITQAEYDAKKTDLLSKM